MRVLRNLTGGAAAVFFVATTLLPTCAGAISVEVAKKMQRAPRKAVSAARTRQSGCGKRKGQWASRKRLFQKMRRQRRQYGQRIRQEHKVTVSLLTGFDLRPTESPLCHLDCYADGL